jgi:hypothetical protein
MSAYRDVVRVLKERGPSSIDQVAEYLGGVLDRRKVGAALRNASVRGLAEVIGKTPRTGSGNRVAIWQAGQQPKPPPPKRTYIPPCNSVFQFAERIGTGTPPFGDCNANE